MTNEEKLMVKEITNLRVKILKLLRNSPFITKYNELITLEEKEGRKVLEQFKK